MCIRFAIEQKMYGNIDKKYLTIYSFSSLNDNLNNNKSILILIFVFFQIVKQPRFAREHIII